MFRYCRMFCSTSTVISISSRLGVSTSCISPSATLPFSSSTSSSGEKSAVPGKLRTGASSSSSYSSTSSSSSSSSSPNSSSSSSANSSSSSSSSPNSSSSSSENISSPG